MLNSLKKNTLAERLIERTSSMLDKTASEIYIKKKMVTEVNPKYSSPRSAQASSLENSVPKYA